MNSSRLAQLGPTLALLSGLLLLLAGTGWLLVPPLRLRVERQPQPPAFRLDDFETTLFALDRALGLPHQAAGESAPQDRAAIESAPFLDWARRLSLGLTGTIPSLEEIRQLELQPVANREAWWIDHLLEDRRTAEHLAERLGRAFVGVENGPFILYRRRRFVSWLADQLAENRPYDQLVRELLASEGIWTEKPAVNFITVTTDSDGTGQPSPIRLATRTSRAFLAMRIDCLECHDDFLGTMRVRGEEAERGGEQADFHRLAAFFSSAQNTLAGVRDNSQAKPYQFTLLEESEPTTFQPAVPLYPEILVAEGSRRQQLAEWLTHPNNRQFARAAVNRIWAIVFGQPLVSPIDDIPWTSELPAALELLADDFIAHGYDLHRLLRIFARSALLHAAPQTPDGNAAAGDWRWTNFPAVRLRPEQVAHALLQSSSLTTLDSGAHVLRRLIGSVQELEFINRYGDFGEHEFEPRSETVAQRLLVLNGNLVREQLEQGYSSPIRLAALAPNPEKALEILFLITLTRRPDAEELARFVSRLESAWERERQARLQDVYWALLNSAEFGTAR